MTKVECEGKMLKLVDKIYKLYKQYNQSGDFLSISMDDDGYRCIYDAYFTQSRDHILDANGYGFHTVHVTKFPNGSVMHSH